MSRQREIHYSGNKMLLVKTYIMHLCILSHFLNKYKKKVGIRNIGNISFWGLPTTLARHKIAYCHGQPSEAISVEFVFFPRWDFNSHH
jgi:hypothetical protein